MIEQKKLGQKEVIKQIEQLREKLKDKEYNVMIVVADKEGLSVLGKGISEKSLVDVAKGLLIAYVERTGELPDLGDVDTTTHRQDYIG